MPHEHYHKWYSPKLNRDIEVLAFGSRGYPVILFPTSKGKFYENKDFKLIDSVNWFLDEGLVKIYCVDGIDEMSWYNKSIHPADRAKNHHGYDLMLYHELVPLAQQETGVQRVATAGCSFGGYHATNFAFKHPEVVKYVFNMGAAFDIKDQVDGHYDDYVYFNNPMDFCLTHKMISFKTCLWYWAPALKICARMRTSEWLKFFEAKELIIGWMCATMLSMTGQCGSKCSPIIYPYLNK